MLSKDTERIHKFIRTNRITLMEATVLRELGEDLSGLIKETAKRTILSERRVAELIKALVNV